MAYDTTKLVTLGQLQDLATRVKAADDALKGTSNDASTDITIYGARALADTKVASVGATSNSGIAIGGTATAPTVGIKLSTKSGNELTFATGSGEDGGLYYASPSPQSVSVVKKSTPNTGYISSYQVTVGGTAVGVDIDIPKDYLVKSAEIKTCTSSDTAVIAAGVAVGEKYIDFTINTVEGTGNTSHIYLGVASLAHVYTAGDGIDISSADAISVKIDSTNANGLSTTSSGLKLGVATDSASGAMSAADHTKLSGITTGATKVEASSTNGNIKINGTETTVYTAPVATDAEVDEMLDELWPTT